MDCDRVRAKIEEMPPDAQVAAHLEGCAACRAEAEFRRRIAGAVAAMPRAAAPEALAARVMAEVRRRPAPVEPTISQQLALRAWEIGWLGALCLVLLALLPVALAQWLLRNVAGDSAAPALSCLAQAPGAWWRAALGMGRAAGELGIAWNDTWLTWLWGAAAFAVALALLLAWQSRGEGSHSMEDAHA